jgi:hypothetical protein
MGIMRAVARARGAAVPRIPERLRLPEEVLRVHDLERALAHHALDDMVRLHDEESFRRAAGHRRRLAFENGVPAEDSLEFIPAKPQVPGRDPNPPGDQSQEFVRRREIADNRLETQAAIRGDRR